MVDCIQIPGSLPDDGQPTTALLQAIVGTFDTEWTEIDTKHIVSRLDDAHSSTHCFLSLSDQHSSRPKNEAYFVKLYKKAAASVQAFAHLLPTKAEEALLADRFGQTAYGPKMIGFFQLDDGIQGRVDEFIENHALEPEDIEDESIRADVAKAFAVFHTLGKEGLRENSIDSYGEAVVGGLRSYHKAEKIKRLAREGGVDLDELVDYDFASKVPLITNRLKRLGARPAWCIHDVQFGNVLVNEGYQVGGGSRIALIDLEFVFRNYRAFDIGGHWFQKMFKWYDEVSKVVDCRPYTQEEKRHFCEVYAKEWNECTGDDDTTDQVLAEASLGYLLALTFDIHFMLMAMHEDDNKDPLDALGLKKMFEEFRENYGLLDD